MDIWSEEKWEPGRNSSRTKLWLQRRSDSLKFNHHQPKFQLPNLRRGRSGGLVLPSLSEFSTVYCDPTVKGFGIVNKAEIVIFLERSCFFDDPVDAGNLISGSSANKGTHLVKAMVFPVVMYGCESWTIKKAERQRIDAFELW